MDEIISVLRGHILRLALLRTGVALLCAAVTLLLGALSPGSGDTADAAPAPHLDRDSAAFRASHRDRQRGGQRRRVSRRCAGNAHRGCGRRSCRARHSAVVTSTSLNSGGGHTTGAASDLPSGASRSSASARPTPPRHTACPEPAESSRQPDHQRRVRNDHTQRQCRENIR